MRRIALATCSYLLFALLATATSASEGDRGRPMNTIAEVVANAQPGDQVVVEGRVADVRTGHGNLVVVIFEDSTGSVPMAVPNSLLRKFAGAKATGGTGPTAVEPQIGARARVRGKWDHEHMNDENWGIWVQSAERIE
jgi:hypothetical protein